MLFGLFSKGIGPLGGDAGSADSRAANATTGSPQSPALRPEEKSGNLTRLQNELNRDMRCPAGKNQVYVRSLVTMSGTTPPRMALKCSYRRDIGEPPDVFLDEMRRLCCGEPEKCEAFRAFQNRITPT
jgi:hypothetical protein